MTATHDSASSTASRSSTPTCWPTSTTRSARRARRYAASITWPAHDHDPVRHLGRAGDDAAAESAGRDPASIRRILNVQGVIGETPGPSRSELPVGYLAGEPLAGPADWWVETLAGFVEDGFDTLVFWPVDPVPGQVELLAGDIVPQLRRSS